MNLYQLLADGSVWVAMAKDTRWVGPFKSNDQGTAFEIASAWCLENRSPGMLIRNRGVMRAPPADWNTPEGIREGEAQVVEDARVKAAGEAGEARIKAEAPRAALIEEIKGLSVPKMLPRLKGLTVAELELLDNLDDRVTASRAIAAEIDDRA